MATPELLVQNTKNRDLTLPIHVIAVYQGQAPITVSMQRVFAAEEPFAFPTGITEGAAKTRILYCYTIEQWKEILAVCVLPQAAQGLKEIMIPLLFHFKQIYPQFFSEIEYDRNFKGDSPLYVID